MAVGDVAGPSLVFYVLPNGGTFCARGEGFGAGLYPYPRSLCERGWGACARAGNLPFIVFEVLIVRLRSLCN